MKRLIVIGLLCCWIACAGDSSGLGAPAPQKYRETLAQPKEISGYPCAKGYAWFYRADRLASCFLAQDNNFGVARAPAGSWITLNPDGKPKILQLVRDTRVLGYMCRGGNRLLGPSEGATATFYPSGKLKECWLAGDQDVQGVPCEGSGMFSGDSSVKFYESGKLESCRVSKDFSKIRRGERFVQTP